MKRIFISHSSGEAALAKPFADWLETLNSENECFCSSRSDDLPPGIEWFDKVCGKASEADVCVILVSSFGASNPWLHFESGLTYGAKISAASRKPTWWEAFLRTWKGLTSFKETVAKPMRIVPAMYAGIKPKHLPGNLRVFQCLFLDNQESLSAFINGHALTSGETTPAKLFADFRQKIGLQGQRILSFGEVTNSIEASVRTATFGQRQTLSKANRALQIPRNDGTGEVRAVRVTFVPKLHPYIRTWKFGITVYDPDRRRCFQVHAGNHDGLDSWTLYYTSTPNMVSIPALIGNDRACQLQLWITADHHVTGVCQDCTGKLSMIINERGESRWLMSSANWDKILLEGWNNSDGHGQELNFEIDVLSYEVDRAPLP